MQSLLPEPLTSARFSAYGDVIETEGHAPISINQGNCLRYTDLASLNIASDGAVGISLFDADVYASPAVFRHVERHPLGSQAFMPTNEDPYLILVADDLAGTPVNPKAFVTSGYQGVNYKRNIWHGVLTPIVRRGLFVVVDYIGAESNLEEYYFPVPYSVVTDIKE